MKVEIEVDQTLVDDAVRNGIEGGIRYWCSAYGVRVGGVGRIRHFTETDGGQEHAVTPRQMAKALAIMAVKHPKHFGDLMSSLRCDATTGDVLIQLACFGELKYG